LRYTAVRSALVVHEIDSEVRAEVYDLDSKDALIKAKIEELVEVKAREKLGDSYELVAAGDLTTIDGLRDELAAGDYLDTLIDRCIKRLMQIKAYKSLVHPALHVAIPDKAT
jgi:hypothetical protein